MDIGAGGSVKHSLIHWVAVLAQAEFLGFVQIGNNRADKFGVTPDQRRNGKLFSGFRVHLFG